MCDCSKYDSGETDAKGDLFSIAERTLFLLVTSARVPGMLKINLRITPLMRVAIVYLNRFAMLLRLSEDESRM